MAAAGSKKTRKAFDVSFKLKAVDFALKSSKEAAASEFGVNAKSIREWCKSREQLASLKQTGKSKKKHLGGGGRKPLDTEVLRRKLASAREGRR